MHIANEDAQTVSNTVQNILSESASALTNGEETTDYIISKMRFYCKQNIFLDIDSI